MPLGRKLPAGRLLGLLADEEVDDLGGRVGHLGVVDFDLGVQHVVAPQGDDRDADTEGRRDEGFGDAAGDGADAARAGQRPCRGTR